MVDQEVGLFVDIGTGKIVQRELGETEFKPISPSNIEFARTPSGGGARRRLEGLRQEAARARADDARRVREQQQIQLAEQRRVTEIERTQKAEAGTIAGQIGGRQQGFLVEDFRPRETIDVRGGFISRDTPSGFERNLGTSLGFGPQPTLGPVGGVRTEPFLEQRLTGTFRPPGTFTDIPTTELVFVDPTGIGRQRERKPTKEEEKFFREQTSVLIATDKPLTRFDIVKQKGLDISRIANIRLRETITEPIATRASRFTGINLKDFESETKFTAQKIRGFESITNIKPAKAGFQVGGDIFEFVGGVGSGGLKFFKERPLDVAIFAGGGALAGAGIGALGLGASTIGGVAPGLTQATLTGGGLVLGGFAGFNIGSRAISAPGIFSSGEVIGQEAVKISALSGGFLTGQSLFQRGVGVIRTRGRTRIEESDIIAPEFFKGQTFPKIRRGQTAGQLRQEFFEPILPGEVAGVGRSFTAAAKGFGKTTTIGRGTSEAPGLFGAPKVSPQFLRVGGERFSLVGKDFLSSGTPTIIRLTPKDLRLAPGISPKQTRLGRFDVKFFEGIKGTGESFIPFAKSEKEAITAFGSPIARTGTQFFTTFKGVRVPINQFVTLPSEGAIVGSGVSTLGAAISSSSGQLAPSSLITPLRVGLSSIRRPSGSKGFTPSRVTIPKSSNISKVSSSVISGISASSISSIVPRQSLSRRSSRSVSQFFSDLGSSSSRITRDIIGPPPAIFSPQRGRRDSGRGIFLPGLSDEGSPFKIKLPKSKPFKGSIRPSFTGIAKFDFGAITGPLPQELTPGLGLLPSQLRLVPGRKKKKGKGKKKKSTKKRR